MMSTGAFEIVSGLSGRRLLPVRGLGRGDVTAGGSPAVTKLVDVTT